MNRRQYDFELFICADLVSIIRMQATVPKYLEFTSVLVFKLTEQ